MYVVNVFRGIYNLYCQSIFLIFLEKTNLLPKKAKNKNDNSRCPKNEIRQNLILITGGGVDVEQLITNNFQLN